MHASRLFRQIILLACPAVILGVGRNLVVPGGIPWVGQWGATVQAAADSIVPPSSVQPGDPPFLTLTQAEAKHTDKNVVFVDARYPADYEQGHITGAVLLPFEMFDDYWAGVEERLPKDREIVTYCGGSECELSLFLARLLRQKGYGQVSVFFGGSTIWEQEGLPMEKGAAPPPGV
ncbi:MAG: rhodanese-like domain-containing protein [Candidatus Zixiibacteriota bacterium]